MKSVVIYKSNTGFTKKYAEWISQELGADIFEVSKAPESSLIKYDAVIYGGGLYAGGINGIKLIKRNLEKLKDKKTAVFATGMSPLRDDVVKSVTDRNFTEEQLKKIGFFYMRGGFNYGKLNALDKLLMSFMKRVLKNKKEKTEDDKGMLSAFENPIDFTDKKNIKDLISYIKG